MAAHYEARHAHAYGRPHSMGQSIYYLLYVAHRCARISLFISVCNTSFFCILLFKHFLHSWHHCGAAGNDIIVSRYCLSCSLSPESLSFIPTFCAHTVESWHLIAVLSTSTLLWVIKSQPVESDNRAVHILCLWTCSPVNLLYSLSAACLLSIFHSSSFPHTPPSARDSSHLFARHRARPSGGIYDHRLGLFSPPCKAVTDLPPPLCRSRH